MSPINTGIDSLCGIAIKVSQTKSVNPGSITGMINYAMDYIFRYLPWFGFLGSALELAVIYYYSYM